MKTKSIYSLFFTFALGMYPLYLPIVVLADSLESTNNVNNEKENPVSEISPYLRPLENPLNTSPPKITTPLPEIKEYTLATGDTITINVFNEGGQGGSYSVFMDGTVSIPLIGNFKIEGMTIKQVNSLFAKEYARYLKRPIVTVTLTTQRPLQLAIAGEVNTPGTYVIPSNPAEQPTITTLFDKAGGLTVSADISQVTLRRTEKGNEEIYVLNFWGLLRDGDLKQDVPLRDGDVIIIPKKAKVDSFENRELSDASFGIKYKNAPTVTLIGEINRPGSYTIGIEGGEPRLTTAIRQGGGIKDLADLRNIAIRRTTRDGEEQTIDVDLWSMLQTGEINEDIFLQDGDKIIIPTAKDIDPTEAQALATANFAPDSIFVNMIGPFKGQGGRKLAPNSSLNQAILSSGGFDERRADQNSVELMRMNPNGTVTKRTIKVNLTANINEETNPILKNNDVILVNRNGLTVFTENLETIIGPLGRTFSFLNFFNTYRDLFDSFGDNNNNN